MKIKFFINVALRAIMRNKLRSLLTILGIVIGVGSVVAMVSIGQGATSSVKASMAKMGNNLLFVRSGSASSGGVHFGAGSVLTLTPEDSEALARECPSIQAVSPMVSYRAQLVSGEKNWVPSSIDGVGIDYPLVMNWHVYDGRWFTIQEMRSGAKVCLLGQTIVKELFSGQPPIGQTMRIGNVPIKVIGILERRGTNAVGRDQDDVVVMPWTTIQMRFSTTGFRNLDRIAVSMTSADATARATQEITVVLRERHRIRPGQADDFNVFDLAQIATMFSETTKVMTSLLAAIASISLLVGGIGIMNIMLVSVSERTREIGIRMAIGARSRDILLQFITESIVLSLLGGFIGVSLGIISSKTISLVANWPTLISGESIIIAIAFSSLIGVIFGYYPAWRASKLDPIECLRYE